MTTTVWTEVRIKGHPAVPHHRDGGRCALDGLCVPADLCGCGGGGTATTPAKAGSECPSWCCAEHGPGETYHAGDLVNVAALVTDVTVQLTYEPADDPEPLVVLNTNGWMTLLTAEQAYRLSDALTLVLQEVGR